MSSDASQEEGHFLEGSHIWQGYARYGPAKDEPIRSPFANDMGL